MALFWVAFRSEIFLVKIVEIKLNRYNANVYKLVKIKFCCCIK